MAKTKHECIEEIPGKNGITYKVHIPYYDDLGIRRFYSKSFSEKKYGTKQKALENAKKDRDEIRVKLANKMIVKMKKASLEEIYKRAFDLHQVSFSTRRKDDSNFYNHIAPAVDISRDFASFRYSDIQSQLNSMVTSCSQDMIKRAFYIWKQCFRYAIADDYVSKDETLKVIIPKSELIIKKKEQTTNYGEVMRVIELIEEKTKNRRNRQLYTGAIWIMLYTGMRPSEVFALESSSVDLKNRSIKVVQRTGSTAKERYTVVKAKTESSVREVYYKPELDDILKGLVDSSINGYLFMKENGKLLNGDEFSDRINKATNGTFRAYSMRHQITTDLLSEGKDLRTIMDIMGHSEGTMTLYYARSNENKKKEAINSRVINGQKEYEEEVKTA